MDKGESVQLNEQLPFKAAEKRIRGFQHLSEAQADGSVIDFLSETVAVDHADVLYIAGTVQRPEGGISIPFYAFHGYEGLFVIPDCLPSWLQVEIAHFALHKAPNAPNNTNLSTSTPDAKTKVETGTETETRAETEVEVEAGVEGVWDREKHLYDAMGPSLESFQPLPKTHVMGRLRWASLGFQYDWTHRRYPQAETQTLDLDTTNSRKDNNGDNGNNFHEHNDSSSGSGIASSRPPVFPPRLATIIKNLVRAVPAAANLPSGTPITIEPEASIVNFFPAGTVMGGHVDDAELTYEHPVVSLSLGRSCVFLIGGHTKGHDEASPLAMVLRSGCALLMHGDSRLRMHGVAKVFPCPCGDARRVPRLPGAAKKKFKGANPVCACVCSSFDQELEPQAQTQSQETQLSSPPPPPPQGTGRTSKDDTSSGEGRGGVLCCHDNLGGVECTNHEYISAPSDGKDDGGGQEAKKKCQGEVSGNGTGGNGVCNSCSQPLLPTLEVQRVLKYMQTARVNINVRQVYPTGTRPSYI